jgi:hypothetical protein
MLALSLLSCHLEANGRGRIDLCDDCASRLSDHNFQMFTSFFISIDEVCWHVAQELFQERALLTIAALHDASALAHERLNSIANATERFSQSLHTLTTWNDRIERSTPALLAWIAALFAVFFVTALSPHLIGARSACTALVIAAACVEWQKSSTWTADEKTLLRLTTAATACCLLFLVRHCSLSAEEERENAYFKKLHRALQGPRSPPHSALPSFEKNHDPKDSSWTAI